MNTPREDDVRDIPVGAAGPENTQPTAAVQPTGAAQQQAGRPPEGPIPPGQASPYHVPPGQPPAPQGPPGQPPAGYAPAGQPPAPGPMAPIGHAGPAPAGYAPAGFPAGAMPGLPPEPSAIPTGPQPYHHGLRRHSGNIWRGIVALLILTAVFAVAQLLAGIVLIAESGLDTDNLRITPVGMLATNLALAALWPASLLIQRMLYGPRPGTLHSVAGKIRWRLFAILAAVLLPAYAIYVVLSPLIMPDASGPGETGTLTGPVIAGFIVVALLTTPFQSAGEEVAFRGLIPRAVGGWFASPRVALVVGAAISSVLFALAHGAGDMWLNGYYLVFAISLTVMTWRTQGLEAAIIAHAANNTFLMILNSAMGVDFDGMFEREAGAGGPFMLVAMVMCVLATALVWWRTGRPKAQKSLQLPAGITPNP